MDEIRNEIIRYGTLESSNTLLKSMARDGAGDGTVIIAETQTGGRGRLGRSFCSPSGGLYLSYLMHPETPPAETAEITMCTGVLMRNVIGECCGIWADIKYVNDLLYNGRKLCGILAELVEGNLIIGIGLNVNSRAEDFPPELERTVISIADICGREFPLEGLYEAVISALNTLNAAWPACREEMLKEYRKYCINYEGQV